MKPSITIWRRLQNGQRADTYSYKFIWRGKSIVRATAHTDKKLARKQANSDLDMRIAGHTTAAETSFRQRLHTPTPATLGQIINCYVRSAAIQHRTKINHVGSLRSLCRHGGAAAADASSESIDALSSSVLTGQLMREMQIAIRATAGNNPMKQDTAHVTANSIRRQARSLFTSELLAAYKSAELHVDVADFMSVKPLDEGTKVFRMPSADTIKQIRAAAPDLKSKDPNAYRIYLLALSAGLRKTEIASARWNWIEEADGGRVIHVQTTDDFRPKSKRDRLVPLEEFVYTELQSIRIQRVAGVDYILDGLPSERHDKSFRRFSTWLAGLGWTRKKKAHELRKVFGSYVCDKVGLSAAQDLLGHSSPEITKQYYVGALRIPRVTILG